jgi:hypothetical protein
VIEQVPTQVTAVIVGGQRPPLVPSFFCTNAVILSGFDMFWGSWKYHTSIPAPDALARQPSA